MNENIFANIKKENVKLNHEKSWLNSRYINVDDDANAKENLTF
jgi:hypothetical protein